jgi:hypothetical protein
MAVVAMVRVVKAAEHWSQQGTKNDRYDASRDVLAALEYARAGPHAHASGVI